jgi:hypothetical protein
MVQAKAPFSKRPAILSISLSLQTPDGEEKEFSLFVHSDGSVVDGDWNSMTGVIVAWKDVVEIQIPKNIFNCSTFKSIYEIQLIYDNSGRLYIVDGIPNLYIAP